MIINRSNFVIYFKILFIAYEQAIGYWSAERKISLYESWITIVTISINSFYSRLTEDQPANFIGFQLPYQVQDEGVIKLILAYQLVKGKEIFYRLICFLTLGLWWLLVRWELGLRIKTLLKPSNINSATHLKIISADDQEELVPLLKEELIINKTFGPYLIFRYRLYKYYFDQEVNQFLPIQSVLSNMISKDIYTQYAKGIQSKEMAQKLTLEYGNNSTEIPEKGTLKILLDEILSPFYLFQVFSVALWCVEKYIYYAGVIFFASLTSIIVTLKEMKGNYHKMRQMSAYQSEEIVYRGGQDYILIDNGIKLQEPIKFSRDQVSSVELVPGDLLEVRDNWTVPCDCILINGSCIINESMLTGESIPIVKTPLSYTEAAYNPLEDGKQCTLFAGTRCIDTRHQQKGKIPILAIVSQTGFATMKGQLVRSILYPKQSKFSFYRDSMMFICVLGIMAFIGFLITIKFQIEDIKDGNLTYFQLVINMLDLITITVPPALPTCLSIGTSFALSRLQKKRIFCISPNRVIIAGKITIMCFDKTGTLTEDGLDLYGVRPVGYSEKKKELHFEDIVMDIPSLGKMNSLSPEFFTQISKQSIYFHSNLQPTHIMLESMSSCHGLTRVNGELIGDPLEIKMFESTECLLQDDNLHEYNEEDIQAIIRKPNANIEFRDSSDVAILKRFEFSSKLQRMSVIVKSMSDKNLRVHVKGSPEKIRELCRPETIPKSFLKILDFYAKSGFRVLATAVKTLMGGEVGKFERDDVEKDLTFIGFMIMQNKLKAVTTSIIDRLQEAHIRTIMVTGDNVLTAISVARQCHLVRADQAIFLGDLNQNGQITWKDFELGDNVLDPDNLSPQQDLRDNPDIEVESFLEEEIENLKKSQFVNENFNKSEQKRGYSFRKSVRKSVKEMEKEMQASNIDHLVDDIVPWKSDENFVIAITGKAFSHMLTQIDTNPKARRVFGIMLERAQVFARMRPEEKALLIQHLQVINRKALCAMCGDGANDCGALKTADVGISLSEAEASIAAPFTSRIQDISCVIKVFREGRAALITSFQCFKYMALYSMIQFTSVTLLYLVIIRKLISWLERI